MKTDNYFLIVVVLFLCTTACEDDGDTKEKKVVGTGPVVTKTLDLSSFNNIKLVGVANFYITIGTPQSVVLKAQQNIIDVITWEVANQTLKVELEENVTIENHEEIRFDITMPEINRIELTGVGNFVLSGDDQDELTIVLTGVGHVKAFDMKVGTCTITSSGVGDCEVYVLNELIVTISGVGNVYYKGNPAITETVTGIGELIPAN